MKVTCQTRSGSASEGMRIFSTDSDGWKEHLSDEKTREIVRSYAMKYVCRQKRLQQASELRDPGSLTLPSGGAAWRLHRSSARIRRSTASRYDKAANDVIGPNIMGSCPALRIAGFAKVIDSYLGSDRRYSKDLELSLQRFMAPRTAVERSVGDALIMLHMSSSIGDSQLLHEARKRHIVGIRWLREALNAIKDPDSVLNAAQILLVCDYYSPPDAHASVWTSHAEGISALLPAIEHQLSSEQSCQRQFSLQQARHIALVHALVCRKTTPGLIYWHTYDHKLLYNEAEELIRLALRLPGLLQAADVVTRRASPSAQNTVYAISDVRSALQHLRDDFEHWYSQHGLEYYFWDDQANAKVYQVQDYPGIAQLSLCFTSLLHANLLGFYWTCLLLLCQAWFCVSHIAQDRSGVCQLALTADFCADMLCGSIPFLLIAADRHIGKALAVRALLHFATDWWRQRDFTKLRWCQDVELKTRKEVPFLNWEALLPCTFFPLYLFELQSARE